MVRNLRERNYSKVVSSIQSFRGLFLEFLINLFPFNKEVIEL